jgi:hypothetical protein
LRSARRPAGLSTRKYPTHSTNSRVGEGGACRIWPVETAGSLSMRGAKAATEETGPILGPELVGTAATGATAAAAAVAGVAAVGVERAIMC